MRGTNGGSGARAATARGRQGQQAGVWPHVIAALLGNDASAGGREDEGGESARVRIRARGTAAYVPSADVEVSVLERITDTSISVRWRDATRCHYDDQIWISCRARGHGRCALTGMPIRPRDDVYKPRARSVAPVNADAMILAMWVAKVVGRQVEASASTV